MSRSPSPWMGLTLLLCLSLFAVTPPSAFAEEDAPAVDPAKAVLEKGVAALRDAIAAIETTAAEAHEAWRVAKRRGGEGRSEEARQTHARRVQRLDHTRRQARSLRTVVREELELDAQLAALEAALARDEPDGASLREELSSLQVALEEARSGTAAVFAIDGAGRTKLHEAAEDEDADLADRALQAGVNPDQIDDAGFSALHLAAWWGADEVVELLSKALRTVDRRAETTPEEGDPLGCRSRPLKAPTALHLACYTGRAGAVKALLAAGADPNLRVEWRDTGTG